MKMSVFGFLKTKPNRPQILKLENWFPRFASQKLTCRFLDGFHFFHVSQTQKWNPTESQTKTYCANRTGLLGWHMFLVSPYLLHVVQNELIRCRAQLTAAVATLTLTSRQWPWRCWRRRPKVKAWMRQTTTGRHNNAVTTFIPKLSNDNCMINILTSD